jgi:hypothetical protein
MSMTAAQRSGEPPRISYKAWKSLSADFTKEAMRNLDGLRSEVRPNPERTPVQPRFNRANLRRTCEVLMAEFLLSLVIVESPGT